jgi:tRNA(Ile)-lysidine synthase
MAGTILPSEADGQPPGWSSDHLRLHRSLLRQPGLLPPGASLLLAVSGGQDSMAMTGLLKQLSRLHHWQLHLWHGDHGWRPDSAQQAQELEAWAQAQHLPLTIARADPSTATGNREQTARRWRYTCLLQEALRLNCSHVLTAHTATDRAESVLLHLARGSHRRGLASLRSSLLLVDVLRWENDGGSVPGPRPGPQLVRPLQLFSRADTARICRLEGWPVWSDPSNDETILSRNRIRHQVLPVLETLHPGAVRRISAQAERLADELECQQQLTSLALRGLCDQDGRLDRRALLQLAPANQRLLLCCWLEQRQGPALTSRSLDQLLPRLAAHKGPGQMDLAGGWQLLWADRTIVLQSPSPAS